MGDPMRVCGSKLWRALLVFALAAPLHHAAAEVQGGPPMAAMVLRKVKPFSVTFTGARSLPNTAFGSKVSGM